MSSAGSTVPTTTSKRHSMAMSVSGEHKTRKTPSQIRFGSYILGATLGEGEFAKVKLCWRKDGSHPSQAAIKLINKTSIPEGSERNDKVMREIQALKQLAHPNIVRLEEVLQNGKYIGIVLEYASGGELFDYILEHRYLKGPLASKLFAQLVSGVDYMHSKGIIHRDLKLENLLLDKHKNIVISDFGFVNTFRGSNDFMKTSCGSPCYAAPELVVTSEPYEGRKVDIWSCGVILYAMLAGYLPYDDDPQNPDGNNIARLYHYITHTPLTFPEYIEPTPRDLLRKIIVSNPKKRLNLKQIRSHPWLAAHAQFLSVTPTEWDNNYRNTLQPAKHQQQTLSAAQRQQEKANRRYSLMEVPGSSSSSMSSSFMNKSNMKAYSSHNVAANMYSNPAAPQTSRAVAVPFPTSISSTNISSQATGPTRPSLNVVTSPSSHNVATNSSYDNSSSNEFYKTGHARSGSTASLVLHAVVEADKAEFSRRNSLTHDSTIASNSSIAHNNNVSKSSAPRPDHSRNNSFTSLSNYILPNISSHNISTITESPEQQNKGSSTAIGLGLMLPPTASTVLHGNTNTAKLPPPRAHNRPRPTSYHPSSSSSNYQFPSPDLSFLLPQKFQDSTSTVNEPISEADESQINSNTIVNQSNGVIVQSANSSVVNLEPPVSPTKENRKSWCQPVVDMTIANGVLSGNDALSSVNSKQENRKSLVITSLTNAIDLYSISSKSTGNLLSEKTEPSPVTASEDKVEASIAAAASVDTPIETITEKESETPKTAVSPSVPLPYNSKHAQSTDSVASKSSKKSVTPSVSATTTTKSSTPTPQINAKQHRRFSMLSFYSSTPASKSNAHPASSAQASRQASSTGSHSQTRKALEPSRDVNIMRQPSVSSKIVSSSDSPASTSRAQKRMTIGGAVPHSAASSAGNANGHGNDGNTSTAKRVMDFFKRKSIRI